MSIRSSYELSKLLLALSDVTRQQLLNELLEPTSVIDICASFDMLVHEAVRHLRRLEDVALIRQLPNGSYVISQYGRAVVPFVEGMSNVNDLLEYWEGHTVTELPTHLRCMPAQLNDLFFSDTALHEATRAIIEEARERLWVLNYPIDQLYETVSDLRVLTSGDAATNSHTRTVDVVFSSLVLNERRSGVFFPRVKIDYEYCMDHNNGFIINEPNPTYRLIAEFFSFLWDTRAHT